MTLVFNIYTIGMFSRDTILPYTQLLKNFLHRFYWAINVGSLLGGVICPLLELHVGFWAAFLLPTCMFVMAITVFVSGNKLYHKSPANGSVILKAWNLVSFANKRARLPENKEARKASKSTLDFAKRNPEELPNAAEWDQTAYDKANWDDQFVDELKQTVMACKIFPLISIYWVCYNQLSNNLLSQAGQLDRPAGLPNDIMNNFDPIALLIFIPICDMLLYPFLRKLRINFASQARITVGFILGALAMAYAAVVQSYIYKDPAYIETGISSLSVFLQIPCYVLIAFSEIFASITAMEYAYTHAPKSMKSLVSALSLWPNCVAALISLAISPSAHDPNMVWVYTGVGVGAFCVGIIYYLLFRSFDVIDENNRLKRVANQDNHDYNGYKSENKHVPENENVALAEAEVEALPR